jgi:DNA polymerase III subunit gamma/tau
LPRRSTALTKTRTLRPDGICRLCKAVEEGRLLDLIEIDAASNRGIDEIRDLREKINFRPNEARYKIYIIDEVHMLTKEAFNALLKTLEEPPAHAVFVLATTEPDRVPETVRSRCQRFDFRRIPTPEIVEHLKAIVHAEGKDAEQEALVAVARRSTGSMRDAISLLDQLLSYGDQKLTLQRVEQVLGLVNLQTIGKLINFMIAGETGSGLTLLNAMVSEGVELSQLVDQVVAYLRGVLFVQIAQSADAVDLPQDVLALMSRQANQVSTPTLLAAVKEFTEARAALKDQVPGVPQLPLEIAFLRAAGAARAQAGPVAAPPAAQTAPSSAPPASAPPPASQHASNQPAPVTTGGAPSAGPRPTSNTAPSHEEPRPPAGSHAPSGTGQAPPPAPRDSAPVTSGAPPEGGANQASGPMPPSPPAQSQLPPEPPRAEVPVEAGDPLGRARDKESWTRFMVVLKDRYGISLQAALRGVKQVDVLNGVLVLSFGAAFHRDMIDQPENRIKVEDAWTEVLGCRVAVRCVLAGATPAAAPKQPAGGSTPAPGDEDDELLDVARKRGAKVTKLD